jgi:predicted HicB family RNase H-like nuclease
MSKTKKTRRGPVIRVPEDLHRRLKMLAVTKDTTLERLTTQLLEEAIR